ncbi:hypothetical protein STVA_44940 [Allostella vacuolata]|nr:hypothetical protein STVA_44940 [Stella vacuolata]
MHEQDSAPAPDALRLERFVPLQGANWVVPRSALIATVRGDFPSAAWPAVAPLLDRLFPAGLPDLPFPPPPADAAEAVEALAGFLLAWVDHPPPAAARTGAGSGARHLAAIPTGSFELTRSAMELAADLLNRAASPDAPAAGWSEGAVARILQLRKDGDSWLPRSRRSLVRAAQARNIPWRMLEPAPYIFQFGEGRFGRRFNASGTWRTGAIASSLAGNKRTGNTMLRRSGLPAARQEPVASADEIRDFARRAGLPVVVKPVAMSLSRGVSLVFADDEIDPAWAAAAAAAAEQPVVAETYIAGNEYRVLVIRGEVAAALMRPYPSVTGDGRHSIGELIGIANADPRRGPEEHGFPLYPIAIDENSRRYLARKGLTYDSIPAAGEEVQVHVRPGMRMGGPWRIDVTRRMHPDNRAMTVRAAGLVGLDVAGIDLRMPDITRSWREVGGGICEVNPHPNLRIHYDMETDLDVAGILLDRCYPPAERGLMRHVLLVSDDDLSQHLAAVAAALRGRFGWRVGTVSRNGVDLDGWRPGIAVRALPEAYGLIAEDPTLDAAVYAAPAEALVATGLGAQRLDAAFAGRGPERATAMVAALTEGLGVPLRRLPGSPETTAEAVVKDIERALAPT